MAPMLGGWLASIWSYEGTFGLGAVVGVAALIASFSLRDPSPENGTGDSPPR
jgi:hypothetical protein